MGPLHDAPGAIDQGFHRKRAQSTQRTSLAAETDAYVGTITPGKYADIIAVCGDVLRDIALLQRVDVIVKHDPVNVLDGSLGYVDCFGRSQMSPRAPCGGDVEQRAARDT